MAQLPAWATIRAAAGYRPRYVITHEDGRLVGGALILCRRMPVFGDLGYVPYGPVVSPDADRLPVVSELTAELERLARHELCALFVQPPAGTGDVSSALARRGFRPSVAGVAPAATLRLDLRRDIEDLRAGLSKSNRRRSRSWEKHGVTVRLGTPADLSVATRLLTQTAEHQRFDPMSSAYLETLYRELDRGGHVVVFLAELDGTPVAARLCTCCGGVMKQRLSGMDRSPRAQKEGVAAATAWHALIWAKAHGFTVYDFGGINVAAADEIERGAADLPSRVNGRVLFKASFGATTFRYPPPVELVSSASLRIGYDLLRRSPLGNGITGTAKRLLRGGQSRRNQL